MKENFGDDYGLLNGGYHFTQAGNDMFQFHVDDHKALQEIVDIKYLQFGGNVSVKANPREKAIIEFGQEEAIFNQNSPKTLQWIGPNGERPLMKEQ